MLSESLSGAPMRIAVLIPCYNEELTVGRMIVSFRALLPDAEIYVYDNNSTDGTADAARAAGVEPRSEPMQGKGHVVRRMFADVEADVYILVDGDGTYDIPSALYMVRKLVEHRLDMVVGRRRSEEAPGAYRAGHAFGNRLLSGAVGFASARVSPTCFRAIACCRDASSNRFPRCRSASRSRPN